MIAADIADDASVGRTWTVTFETLTGNVPMLRAKCGRLFGVNHAHVPGMNDNNEASCSVAEVVQGTDAVEIYAGTTEPSVREFVASQLATDNTYAFKVAAVNAIGLGEASPASSTVVARAGASAQHTTASGSALRSGITGAVFEEQRMVLRAPVSRSQWQGSFALHLGSLAYADLSTQLSATSNATDIAEALEGLTTTYGELQGVHVTLNEMSDNGDHLAVYAITFRGSPRGDIGLLSVSSSNLTYDGTNAVDVTVTEFIKGVANEFIIEPAKASGHPVTDRTAEASMRGEDLFFTELWDEEMLEWIVDDGEARYEAVQYDVQAVRTSTLAGPITGGFFQLQLDTSSYYNGGSVQTTELIPFDASAVELQIALEALPDISSVDIARSDLLDGKLEWVITFTGDLGDLPEVSVYQHNLTGNNSAVQTFTVQDGVTEVQTVTLTGDERFTFEEQALKVYNATGGTISLQYGSNDPVLLDYNASASEIEAALETLDGLTSIAVSGSSPMWMITFMEPVGDVVLLTLNDSALDCPSSPCGDVEEIQQGSSPVSGSFVMAYQEAHTGSIPFDASADALRAALEQLSTVDRVNVERELLVNGFRWTISFLRNAGNLPNLNAYPIRQEIQIVEVQGGSPTPIDGSFMLSFHGERTGSLPFDATTSQVEAALEALGSVGRVDVRRDGPLTGGHGRYRWQITFLDPSLGNVELLVAHTDALEGTDADVLIWEQQAGSTAGIVGDLHVEEQIAGRPYYVGKYTPTTVGSFNIVVQQLSVGGLTAEYYDNQWLSGTPSMSTVDSTIDFDWQNGLITPYGRDFVSVRWKGKVQTEMSENFTFHVECDDGVRLWVNHEKLIDAWDNEGYGEFHSAEMELDHALFHDIVLEYIENTGPASVRLFWSSQSTPREIIPTDRLYRAEHIVGSPFATIVVPGASDYPFSSAWGPGLNATGVRAGIVTRFLIESRDALDNVNVELGEASEPGLPRDD